MLTSPNEMATNDLVDSYCFAIPSMFSFLGCSFVVGSFFAFKKLQTLTFQIIATQMVAEGLYNLTHAIFLYPPEDKTPLCTIMGFTLAWSLNVTILMTGFMSYHMYFCIKRKSAAGYSLTKRRLNITVGGVVVYATLVASIPLYLGAYGLEGSQCWLSTHDNHAKNTALTLGVLYAPLWTTIFFSSIAYTTVYKYVRHIHSKTTACNGANNESSSNKTENVVRKLMHYPGIMILCWSMITLYRVHIMIWPEHNLPAPFLWTAHIFSQTQGVLDAIVFASYDTVRMEYRKVFRSLWGLEQGQCLQKKPAPEAPNTTFSEYKNPVHEAL